MNSAATGSQVKTKHKSVSYDKYGYFFILPFFIVFAIFGAYPIYFTFRTALTDAVGWDMINNNHIIGFGNFAQFFDPSSAVYPRFWGALVNTLIIWIPNFVAQLGLALILASWFTDSRMHLKFQGGFKVMIFMPNIITAATVAMLFFSLFNYPIAPINTLMQSIGVLSSPFEFFRSTEWSRGIISFIQWWMWVGNTMIIMIAGISGINPSLFEAALVDGCSSRQTFWKITLPLIKPILVYNLVTSLVGGLTMFDIPQLMTQGNPNNTTDTVVRFIYNQGFTGSFNFNTASAASMILFVIIIIGSIIIKWVLSDHDDKPAKAKKGV
ncbi:MAG: sugar ABC transporter permease [Clostridia bacterium]|nr:sugar ABC transporter permease [Clostridia bacterium]